MSNHRLLKQLVFGLINNLRPPSCPRSSFNNAVLSSCRNYCVNGRKQKKVAVQVRDMPDGSARWIAKPSITNQAAGICIFDRVSQLEAALQANENLREWVLQRSAS